MAQIEIRKKMEKLDTLIAAFDPSKEAFKSYQDILGCSAITVIHSPVVPVGTWPAKVNGLHIIQQKKFPPAFNVVIGDYMSRVRGNTNVGFVLPGVKINSDLSHMYRYADENRMERTYGYYVIGPDQYPIMFVFTGNIPEFMFHAIHHSVVFGTPEWAKAVHAWAQKGLMKHRYFDATAMNVASFIQPLPPPTIVEEIVATAKDAPSRGIAAIKELFTGKKK